MHDLLWHLELRQVLPSSPRELRHRQQQANRVAEQSLKLLAPQLRKLHALKQLDLYETVMTDAALEALVAEPLAGMWKALKYLRIEGN